MKLRKEHNPVAHHSVAAYASCFCKYSSCACGCYDLCTCAGTGLYTSTSNANGGNNSQKNYTNVRFETSSSASIQLD